VLIHTGHFLKVESYEKVKEFNYQINRKWIYITRWCIKCYLLLNV